MGTSNYFIRSQLFFLRNLGILGLLWLCAHVKKAAAFPEWVADPSVETKSSASSRDLAPDYYVKHTVGELRYLANSFETKRFKHLLRKKYPNETYAPNTPHGNETYALNATYPKTLDTMRYVPDSILLANPASVPPTLFIPGLGGSSLYASFENANLSLCSSDPFTDYTKRMWVPFYVLSSSPQSQNCWAQKLALAFDPVTSLYSSIDGATFRSGLAGTTRDIQFLDYFLNLGLPGADYLDVLIESFNGIGSATYGFPYDWRFPIRQLNWEALKYLVEKIAEDHQQKISILAHSHGAVVITYFLNRIVDAAWKERYIESFVSISGSYGGSVNAAKALFSGYNPIDQTIWKDAGIVALNANVLIEIERSLGAVYSALPAKKVLGEQHKLLTIKQWKEAQYSTTEGFMSAANTETFVYTLQNWTKALPSDLQFKVQLEEELMQNFGLSDPGVPVSCIWSRSEHNVTEVAYSYDYTTNKTQPDIEYGEGDGTIPLLSLSWCTRWKSTLHSIEIQNETHVGILKKKKLFDIIAPLIVQPLSKHRTHEVITLLD